MMILLKPLLLQEDLHLLVLKEGQNSMTIKILTQELTNKINPKSLKKIKLNNNNSNKNKLKSVPLLLGIYKKYSIILPKELKILMEKPLPKLPKILKF